MRRRNLNKGKYSKIKHKLQNDANMKSSKKGCDIQVRFKLFSQISNLHIFFANLFVFILFGWDEEICMQIIWFIIYFHSFNYFSFERMKFISHLGRAAVLYQHFRWDQRKSIENRIEEPQISSKFTKCMFCVSAVGHSIKKNNFFCLQKLDRRIKNCVKVNINLCI